MGWTGLGRWWATFIGSSLCRRHFVVCKICRDLPNNLAMCLINWWLHSGRSVSNSTLQKQRLWQLKRNHRKHWRPALVWRWQGWFNGISTQIFWCYDYIGGCILRLRPEKARQFSVQAWPDLTWLHRWFVLQLGTAKNYTTDLRKLDVHCWKLLDVLWVRQLPLIGTSHGIQYLMHGTDGLINNWNTMVSKCGQRNVVNGQCLHAARRAYFGHRRQQWSVFGVVTVPCTRNVMHLTSFFGNFVGQLQHLHQTPTCSSKDWNLGHTVRVGSTGN